MLRKYYQVHFPVDSYKMQGESEGYYNTKNTGGKG